MLAVVLLASSVCVACGSGGGAEAGGVPRTGRAAAAGLAEHAPARPKLMVVFARTDNETAAPRSALLFGDAVDSARRRWDFPEEAPHAELLPPHGLPGTHGHQNAADAAGYDYSAPQQDVQQPTGYSYPKPTNDVPEYNYPKPQQQDDGDHVDTGYSYPRPGQAAPWNPLSDQDYLPPKQQLPLDDLARPAYGTPAAATTNRPQTTRRPPPALQDELPYSDRGYAYAPPKKPAHDAVLDDHRPTVPSSMYGAPSHAIPSHEYTTPPRQHLQDTPSDGYLPAGKQPLGEDPAAYGAPTQPLQDAPLDSYLPPKKPPPQDAPLDSYLPPSRKPPPQDAPLDSYLPPKKPPSQDVPQDSYLPPKQQPSPSLGYGPPGHQQDPVRDDAAVSGGYPPPRQVLADDGVKAAPQVARPRHLGPALKAGSVDEHGIRVTDMSCLRTGTRARFTATISSPAFVAWPPVLEVPGGGAAPTGCRIIADPADPHHRFLVDLSNPDLSRCGVKGCSADGEARLCSRLVLPSLPGLRLASDPVLLLQCALQPAVGSVLQQARISAAQPAAGRSAGVVHAGGERASLHAHLQLFRRGAGGAAGEFSRQMQSGGAVLLGEDLQLRAVVRRGDGWQSSRLADVVVRRGSDAVQLVSADGCPNADMRAVSPRPQAWLTGEPLVSLLNMRVFMFRGMSDGDQMIVSARVVACLDRADCKLSAESCKAAGHGTRVKRNAGQDLTTATTAFEGNVSFVVRMRGARPFRVLDGERYSGPDPGSALRGVSQLVVRAAVACTCAAGAGALLLLSASLLCGPCRRQPKPSTNPSRSMYSQNTK